MSEKENKRPLLSSDMMDVIISVESRIPSDNRTYENGIKVGLMNGRDFYEPLYDVLWNKYRRMLADWVDSDEMIERTAKLVFDDKYIEGDSYGVPGSPTIVDFLTAYIYVLTESTPPEGEEYEDLRWEMNRIRDNEGLTKLNRENS